MEELAKFAISAFGDEIADDLSEQLRILRDLQIGALDLRAAWGKKLLQFDKDDINAVRNTCAEQGMAVSCIGSPIGKSPIVDPIEQELSNLLRIFRIGDAVGTRRVRVFSFYPRDRSTNAHYDQHVDEAVSRLTTLVSMAQRDGFTLLLENEKGIVGDTIQRCHAILSGLDSVHVRFLWDPANFVQVGEAKPTDDGWASLGPFVGYVHIKDAVSSDGSIRPAGEGDGQVGALLTKLRQAGYRGYLALEPHLAVAGHSGGFSGADGMERAVDALRKLMAQTGCVEEQASF
jgi:sugar phosphate isomerase/epimerase